MTYNVFGGTLNLLNCHVNILTLGHRCLYCQFLLIVNSVSYSCLCTPVLAKSTLNDTFSVKFHSLQIQPSPTPVFITFYNLNHCLRIAVWFLRR